MGLHSSGYGSRSQGVYGFESDQYCRAAFCGKCKRFHYRGCGGNDNPLESKEKCEASCFEKKHNNMHPRPYTSTKIYPAQEPYVGGVGAGPYASGVGEDAYCCVFFQHMRPHTFP